MPAFEIKSKFSGEIIAFNGTIVKEFQSDGFLLTADLK